MSDIKNAEALCCGDRFGTILRVKYAHNVVHMALNRAHKSAGLHRRPHDDARRISAAQTSHTIQLPPHSHRTASIEANHQGSLRPANSPDHCPTKAGNEGGTNPTGYARSSSTVTFNEIRPRAERHRPEVEE